jgi:hypothetical protein
VSLLGPTISLIERPLFRSFHLIFEFYAGRALAPIPKRSASDIDTAAVDSLKVLDPEPPMGEANC